MTIEWKTIVWQQFGAAIDMFGATLDACPEQLWQATLWEARDEPPEYAQFWYLTYHTLFWLDLYLSGTAEGFTPPAPFTLAELDPAGLLPERPYTRDNLRAYLAHCRRKCQRLLTDLTDETATRRCRFSWGEVAFAELQLYNMRHVQEHAAQLGLFLGQRTGWPAGWVARARPAPGGVTQDG